MHTVDVYQLFLFIVVVDKRFCGSGINLKTIVYRFGLIVVTVHKCAAAFIAIAIFFGGNMVAFSALGADASARKTFGKSIEIHVDVDYGVNVGNFIKRLRLSDGPGKSVEKEAVFSVILIS